MPKCIILGHFEKLFCNERLMLPLTRQQRNVLLAVLFLMLTGWAVKSYRLAHPPAPTEAESRP